MIKRIELLVLGTVLLGGGVLVLNWALQSAIHSQKEIQVPDLTNKSLNDALEILAKQNLGLKKEGDEFNDTVPAGTILRQQPAAGSTVREGKMVRVTLSQGGEIVVLPDVTGQSLRSAQITLRNHSLTLAEIENRPSVQYEKDTVISQSPPPNSIMKKNAPVRLVVSNGPPMDGSILMPDFVGKEWDDVVSWAANSGMQVKKIEDPKASASYGFIFKQSVKPDEVLEPNSTLVFTLSTNAAELPASKTLSFHFEVPQGDAAKLYSFVLVEPTKTQEIWKARLQPGSKHDISLPAKIAPNAKIRIFVNGILTEERNVQ